MHNITVFNTEHGEAGKCNINELYRIIESINPEIIFEEIPPCVFDEYYKNMTRNNLETNAIKIYLKNHNILHIPVDYDIIMPQSFWDNNKYLFEQVERSNSEFCKLIDRHSQYVRIYGFNYLNSIYCINNRNDYYKEMEITLKKINKGKLFEIYNSWNDVNKKRENEMINNIYIYCKEHDFNKGIFFIGAAHRESIITTIQKYNEIEEVKINWEYIDYENNAVRAHCI